VQEKKRRGATNDGEEWHIGDWPNKMIKKRTPVTDGKQDHARAPTFRIASTISAATPAIQVVRRPTHYRQCSQKGAVNT